jgi:hypothetical protein
MAASGQSVEAHPVVLALLRSPLGRWTGGLCELRFTGRRSGRTIALPVQCAREDDRLVIYVGGAAAKRWWRNFVGGHPVRVRVGGELWQGRGIVVDLAHPDRDWAERTYRRRYRRVNIAGSDPIVLIDLATRIVPGPRPGPDSGQSSGGA